MRKIAIALLALSLTAIAAAPAGAVSLLAETFTYADGPLRTTSGGLWTLHSGSTVAALDIQVLSGVAKGTSSNAPDDNRALSAAQGATDKTYYCLNLMVPTPAAAPPTGMSVIAHLKDSGTFNFAGRLYLIPRGGNYTVGLSYASCNASEFPPCQPTLWPGTLNYGQQYVIVVSYDATSVAAGAELWVNPLSPADPKITHNFQSSFMDAGGTMPVPPQNGFLISTMALRQGGTPGGQSGTANWVWNVDNIGVGTSFSDACASGPVPANQSTWGRVKTLYRN